MATIDLIHKRVGNDIQMAVQVLDNGTAISWSEVSDINARLFSDSQRVRLGMCSIDGALPQDETTMMLTYSGDQPQYLGVARLVLNFMYHNHSCSLDAPVIYFVASTAEEGIGPVEVYIPADVDPEINSLEIVVGRGATASWGTISGDLSNQTDLMNALGGKQDVIPDLPAIRSGAAAGSTAYRKPTGGIPASDIAPGVIPSDIVKYSAQSLTDSQKEQARANIGALSSEDVSSLTSQEYVIVTTLPTATAGTIGKIYLVGPDANNNYERYITSFDGTTYSWVPIGDTEIDLGGFATIEEAIRLSSLPAEFVRCPYNLLSGGAFGTNAETVHAAIRCTPGERYYISNHQEGTGSSNTRYALATSASWHSGASVPLISGASVVELERGTSVTVTIPDGCNYLIVNYSESSTSWRFDVLRIGVSEGDGSSSDYSKMTPSSITDGSYFNRSNSTTTDSNYAIYKYAVTPQKRYAFSGQFSASVNIFFLAWANSEGTVFCIEPWRGDDPAGSVKSIYLQDVKAPEGAAYAYLNVLKSISRIPYFAFFEVAERGIQRMREDERAVMNAVGYSRYPYNFTMEGNFATNSIYWHAAIEVIPGERYVIRNSQSQSDSWTRYAFVTSDAYEVSGALPLVEGTSVQSIPIGGSVTVTIPEGCKYILVCNTYAYLYADVDVRRDTSASPRKRLRFLAIGNSYSQDALAYVPFILDGMGEDIDLTIGILMQSSSTVSDHWSNFQNNTAAYTFNYITPGASAWSRSTSKTMKWALETYEWDVIMFHNYATAATNWSSHQPYINKLINGIHTLIDYPVKFAWMLPQEMPAKTNGGANWSDAEILSRYESAATNSERVINETLCDIIIPTGTAIQNARTIASLKAMGAYASNSNNTSGNGYLCPDDGVHLQEGLPCQIAAYTVILSILDLIGASKKSVYGEGTRVTSQWAQDKAIPSPHGDYIGSTDENCRMGQMCAIMAHKDPYEVTDMNYIVNPT